MSDSVDRVFVHALNTVKRIPRSGSARPPLPERLRLYGLYKQSMEGDVEGVMDRPVDDESDLQAEREKWDAWYAQRHLSRTEAKRQYITALLDTMNKYASSTPEARELISELEFVWDQIKANSPSSHSSGSPIHASSISPPQHQPSRITSPTPPSRSNYGSQYGSIGGRISRGEAAAEEGMERPIYAGRDSRLRVLSPVSQPDDEIPGSGRRNYNARGEEGAGADGDRLEEEEDEDEEDEEDEEEFQEARDSPFEDDNDDNKNNDDDDEDLQSDNNNNHNNGTQQQPRGRNRDRDKDTPKPKATTYNRRWRRRVEQALTKMTAEVAAMREQMETRALNSRRRSSLWAWIKWVVWVVVRQVCWDFVLFGCVLVWMRVVRGDRRLEEKVRGLGIWREVRRRVVVVVGRGEGGGKGVGV